MTFTVVEEGTCAAPNGIDEQVQVAIAIEVRQHSAGRVLVWASDAGRLRDILEFPIPKISIEHIGTLDSTKINVTPPVAIDITERDTGTIFEDAVFGHGFVGK